MLSRILISFFGASKAKDCLESPVAYLGEVQVAQVRGFAELALEGEEGRGKNWGRAEGRKRARGSQA